MKRLKRSIIASQEEGWGWEPEDDWNDPTMYDMPKYDWHEIPGFEINDPQYGDPAYIKPIGENNTLVIEQTTKKNWKTELYSWVWYLVESKSFDTIRWSGNEFNTPEEAIDDFAAIYRSSIRK